MFEAYKLLRSVTPRSERLQQVLILLLREIEKDGSMTYVDPQTGNRGWWRR